MPQWDMNVQRMIDYLERHIRQDVRLEDLAAHLGYSPYYCTRQFHRVVGMSLRRYLGQRRLSLAAHALRDTRRGILDIALDLGFSSQEALTRAFRREWDCTPAAWRRQPTVLPLTGRRAALSPLSFDWGPSSNPHGGLRAVECSIQRLPARRFVGYRIPGATDYRDFWRRAVDLGMDCHAIEGHLASLSANAPVGGWYNDADKSGYLFGLELPPDYRGPIPPGAETMLVPAADYAVFHHPPYDFASEEPQVWQALRQALTAWNPAERGLVWNPVIPTWQRHEPELLGQAWSAAVSRSGGDALPGPSQ